MSYRQHTYFAVFILFCATTGCQPRAAPQGPRATEADLNNVQETILGVVGVYNQPKAVTLSVDERSAQLAKFYVPDGAFSKDDVPMFFDPPRSPSRPVVIGTAEHLRNMSMVYDGYAQKGFSYSLQLSETQVRIDGALAVVIAKTTGIVRTLKGEIVDKSPGRWTVVLELVGNRWLISHEHISFFTEAES